MKRLRAVAKSTAEKASKEKAVAAAQPLEASQRAVIRDLSLRVANLTRTNNQLKEERERAQVIQFLDDLDPWSEPLQSHLQGRPTVPAEAHFTNKAGRLNDESMWQATLAAAAALCKRQIMLMKWMTKYAQCAAFTVSTY